MGRFFQQKNKLEKLVNQVEVEHDMMMMIEIEYGVIVII